ncbi:Aste57867_3418 [Aphanomyces stellatus]|uniref:Aste57867_3418 protein n=1 Tax=Aphanomyces stellatus TaxID=120398 RepID=A0A485KBC1_9STRA|nr:hypothetical protein As57867_003408 [Aphanomyces stellatus]VFT80584.1 Aste57867_3418 [Aphanomyces stellatus]
MVTPSTSMEGVNTNANSEVPSKSNQLRRKKVRLALCVLIFSFMRGSVVPLLLALATAAPPSGSNERKIMGIDGVTRSMAQVLAINYDADNNRKCHLSNSGYLTTLAAGQYTNSSFFNCFRTSAQVYEFLDAVMGQNTRLVRKVAVANTTQGAIVYGYKLSTGTTAKPMLYFQSLIHAREWIAGTSNVFTLSAYLDDLTTQTPGPYDAYDLMFVPILNLDGYDLSWTANRYQRKNANNIDLNRNWPTPYTNPVPDKPVDETYPGVSALSEVESSGLNGWLRTHQDSIEGYVDIHACAGLILYAFGDTHAPLGNGFDEKFQLLAGQMQLAMGALNYDAQPVWQLYDAYGGFSDYTFRYYKKASVTIEVAGADFAVPTSEIRPRGKEVLAGITAFAKGVAAFNSQNSTTNDTRSGRIDSVVVPPQTSTPIPTSASGDSGLLGVLLMGLVILGLI